MKTSIQPRTSLRKFLGKSGFQTVVALVILFPYRTLQNREMTRWSERIANVRRPRPHAIRRVCDAQYWCSALFRVFLDRASESEDFRAGEAYGSDACPTPTTVVNEIFLNLNEMFDNECRQTLHLDVWIVVYFPWQRTDLVFLVFLCWGFATDWCGSSGNQQWTRREPPSFNSVARVLPTWRPTSDGQYTDSESWVCWNARKL